MPDLNSDTQVWLSISEAAERLGVHATTLRRWADSGQISCSVTPGGHRRFSVDDVEEFATRGRRLRRSGDFKQTWAETAMTVTRSRLAVHKDERWLGKNGGWREQHRKLGRQLMGITLQYISAVDEDAEQLLQEARNIGRRYARIAHQNELPLAEVLSASIFFRDMLIESALQLPDNVRLRSEANLRLMRKINSLLNTVHLTIAEEYDEVVQNNLSRD